MIDCTVKTLNQLWRTPEDGEQGCFTRRMFIHLTRHWTQKTSGNAINVSEFKKQNPWVSESEESHPPTIIHRNSPSLIIIIVIYWNQHLFLWPSSSQSSSSSSASSHRHNHDSSCIPKRPEKSALLISFNSSYSRYRSGSILVSWHSKLWQSQRPATVWKPVAMAGSRGPVLGIFLTKRFFDTTI